MRDSQTPPGVLLAPDPEPSVEWVVGRHLDGVALRVEVLKVDVTALEPLPEEARGLRGVGHVVEEELAPDGGHGHQVGVLAVALEGGDVGFTYKNVFSP